MLNLSRGCPTTGYSSAVPAAASCRVLDKFEVSLTTPLHDQLVAQFYWFEECRPSVTKVADTHGSLHDVHRLPFISDTSQKRPNSFVSRVCSSNLGSSTKTSRILTCQQNKDRCDSRRYCYYFPDVVWRNTSSVYLMIAQKIRTLIE